MITPISATLFSAPSLSGGTPYTIDIAAHRGNGSCNCPDFITRCKPAWEKTKVVVEWGNDNRTR